MLRGLRDFDVLAHPPKSETELGYLAETITDSVASDIELSRDARREARKPHERPGYDGPPRDGSYVSRQLSAFTRSRARMRLRARYWSAFA